MPVSSTNTLDSSLSTQMLNKVPEITLFFWIIKVLCTTVGETAADFLNVNLNFGLTGTSVVTGILFFVVLFFQLRAKKYVPGIYWLTVVLISVFGTLVTDNLTDKLGVPLETSTIFFTIILGLTFLTWYLSEKTLSIHSIFTRKRELFYWLTILFTFALGTASGDLMAEGLGLGYLLTGAIVAGTVGGIALAWRSGLNAILAFWLIYILTRPLGASLGDFLSQPHKYGGLELGATVTSVIFLLAILGTVTFLSLTKKDVIAKSAENDTPETPAVKQKVEWQVGIVLVVLLLVSTVGYYWRHNALQSSTEETSAPSGTTSSGSPRDATSSPLVKKTSPLGDLTTFKTITQDTFALVNIGDMPGATKRVADLEYEWDAAEAHLKPMSQTKWAEVDGAIDKVLRQLRAVHPDAQGSKSALEILLTTLG